MRLCQPHAALYSVQNRRGRCRARNRLKFSLVEEQISLGRFSTNQDLHLRGNPDGQCPTYCQQSMIIQNTTTIARSDKKNPLCPLQGHAQLHRVCFRGWRSTIAHRKWYNCLSGRTLGIRTDKWPPKTIPGTVFCKVCTNQRAIKTNCRTRALGPSAGTLIGTVWSPNR